MQFVKNMKASTANEPQEVMNGFKGVNSIKMIREKRQAENFRGAAGGVVFDVEGIKAGDYEWSAPAPSPGEGGSVKIKSKIKSKIK